MSWQSVLSILAACLVLVAAGCEKKSSPAAHGHVTLDGEPVAIGNIVFLPESMKGPKAAAAIENGAYALSPQDKLLPGKYRVEISWRKPTGKKIPSADPGITIDETREAVPAKYNTESTLIAQIAAEDSEKNFTLTSK
jgi:hypothetical protein